MIAPLLIALASLADPALAPPPPPPDERPGHAGQIDLHLDLGEPVEVDQVGTKNSGRGLLGIGGGYWFPLRLQVGAELRVGSIAPPGLKPVGVDWAHLLVAKGFSPADNWLLSGGLMLGFYNNTFTLFPDAGIRVRALYEIENHFDVGLALTTDLAVGPIHDPIFLSVEATFGFSFR